MMKKLLLIISLLLSFASFGQIQQKFGAFSDNLDSLFTHVGREHQYLVVLGRFSPNDGLGGIYIWDSAATSTEIPYINFKVVGKDTGRWQLVQMFGQGGGGGSTNVDYAVLNILSTPPTATLNAKYIVNPPGAGAWVGHDNNIAIGTGTGWTFDTAKINQIASNAADNNLYVFTVSGWVALSLNLHQNGENYGNIDIVAGNTQNKGLYFITNNSRVGGFDSIGRFYYYNPPIGAAGTDSILVTTTTGIVKKITATPERFGIEDNTGVQNRSMRMTNFNLNIDSIKQLSFRADGSGSQSNLFMDTASLLLNSKLASAYLLDHDGSAPSGSGSAKLISGNGSVTTTIAVYAPFISLIHSGVNQPTKVYDAHVSDSLNVVSPTKVAVWDADTLKSATFPAASGGTVTSFSAGTLSPLFTTSVATATTTPALSFTLSNAGANTVLGNATGSSGVPSYGQIVNGQITNATIDLTTKVTGALPIANAGTNITTYNTGDILYASATNVLSKLPIGTTSQTLHVVGGIPAWRDTVASGGGLTRQIITSGSSGTVTGSNYVVTIDPASTLAAYTLTLPASPTDLQTVEVDFGGTLTNGTIVTALTISPNSGQTILDNTPPTTATADNTLLYRYRAANTTWYRFKP